MVFIVHALFYLYGRWSGLSMWDLLSHDLGLYIPRVKAVFILFSFFFVSPEFDAEEYKAAKADPISQFSVPVTV